MWDRLTYPALDVDEFGVGLWQGPTTINDIYVAKAISNSYNNKKAQREHQ